MSFSQTSRILMLLVVVTFTACGDDSKPSESNNGQIDLGTDLADLSEVDMGEPEYVCPDEGDILCGGSCVEGTFNMDNCGTCGNACTAGKMTCRDSTCQCLGERTMCGRICFDTTNSRSHCGSCDNECDLSEACVSGSCVLVSDRDEVVGVLQYTNETRSEPQNCDTKGMKNAAGELQLNDILMVAAQGHAEDMAENMFMEHEGSDGSSPSQRASRAGYAGSRTGENIARGYKTPKLVVEAWLKSDGHCSNMMNDSYTEIGIGFAVADDGEMFWVQLFGAQN